MRTNSRKDPSCEGGSSGDGESVFSVGLEGEEGLMSSEMCKLS